MFSLGYVATMFTHKKAGRHHQPEIIYKMLLYRPVCTYPTHKTLIANVKIVFRSSSLDHGVLASASNLGA